MAATIDNRVAELERASAQLRRQLDACSAELKEAREQQTATAEVLQVINSSAGDLAPVFEAILEKAMRTCEAAIGMLHTWDGKVLRPMSMRGVPPRFAEFAANPANQLCPGGATPRLIRGERIVHVMDLKEEEPYQSGDPYRRALVDIGGARTLLAVPLRRDGVMLGVINIYRQEVRPYTDKQIALLENFAAQAVIAMENARLLTETREALEQQTATAEVLQVINSSPGDLTPVLDAMLEKAHSLCGVARGSLELYDGQNFRAVATRGLEDSFADQLRQGYPASKNPATRPLIEGQPFSQIVGPAQQEFPFTRSAGDAVGIRTLLCVPLRRDDKLLGMIASSRDELRPFTDKQIALLQNFAAQAVIAMENARLLTETREALEQQTATAEVLQVINSSPGDLAPVFDAILEKAHSLCGVAYGSLELYDGERFRSVAEHGLSDSFATQLRQGYRASDSPATQPLLAGNRFTHIADAAQVDFRIFRSAAELEGIRTVLFVPLRRDDALLGMIACARREVRSFSEKEIALLENFAAQAVIAIENARLLTETREALEQQTATAEVLQVINSSPGDLAPVFDAMVERAARLCEAEEAALRSFDGELLHLVAVHGSEPDVVARLRQLGPTRAFGLYEPFARGERVVQFADVRTTDVFRHDPVVRERLEIRGIRTWLAVALHKDGVLLGVINVHRHTVRPFTDKQIALLENFAAQAVIAMENARLITETREALEQQTATAEVLQVINSSPGDLAPVFDAMLDRAIRLCEAAHGHFLTYDGETFHPAAVRGEAHFAEYWRQQGAFRPSEGNPLFRLVHGERIVHLADAREDSVYRDVPVYRRIIDIGEIRTSLTVPLRKDGALLGAFVAYRQEVRPFSDKQIALLQNFAAQAVIAMENARLITETREALEQQTATAEVLQVINSSPGDVQPTFDAIAASATRLCEAVSGAVFRFDGSQSHLAAHYNCSPAELDALRATYPLAPSRGSVTGRAILTRAVAHVADIATDPDYALPSIVQSGMHAHLSVPMLLDGHPVGAITVARREAKQFSETQIELLKTFAAQAVIAMENARLITETREALEQQTATAEVLGVINSSPGDLAPVFDAILEKAHSLCGVAKGSLELYDGQNFRAVATRGLADSFADELRQGYPASDNPATRPLIEGQAFTHIPDRAQHTFPFTRRAVDAEGAHTLLCVPLRRDDKLLGMIAAAREEVRPFSEKQIALLQNFAAQAVIAMENARLITETREALEQQTATAEVLQVINSSPGDLAPVFDAILEKAHSLCDVAHGSLQLYDGVSLRAVATHGVSDAFADILRHGYRAAESPASRGLIEGRRFVQIADCAEIDHPVFHSAAELAGIRTVLFVPLRRDDALLGLISSARREVRLFSDKEIALLQNFAAQAVIAMENARLLTETREALEQQTATAEVLQVINSSPGELAPVFDAMLEKATRLCDAAFGTLSRVDGDHFQGIAWHNAPQAFAEAMRQPRPIVPGNAHYRLLQGEDVVQIEDVIVEDIYRAGNPARRALADLAGARTVVWAALRKDGELLGAFVVYRTEVRPFSDKQIALLQNFAAQAVIAMENARLLTETREALEQQTATAEVLQVINSSPGDLAPVFDAILEKATHLCDVPYGSLELYDGERFRAVAVHGLSKAFADKLQQGYPASDNPATRPLIEGSLYAHITDLAETDYSITQSAVELVGARTLLCVPLRRDNALLGMIACARQELRPFSEKEIALLQNFAAQAVIAVENARLITETREALEQQTATAEVLQVINSSPGDLVPVFDTILEKAHTLCGAAHGIMMIRDGERFRTVAVNGVGRAFVDAMRQLDTIRPREGGGPARLIQGDQIVQFPDLQAESFLQDAPPQLRRVIEIGDARTMLMVPLRKDDDVIGIITAFRQEVRLFTNKQIALLQNFAAQAVIAMENARLITETREALEQQTATAEVLQVINSSPGDLTPVVDAMLERAVRLCGAVQGVLWFIDGERLKLAGTHRIAPAFIEVLRKMESGELPAPPQLRRLMAGERIVHIDDVAELDIYRAGSPLARAAVETGLVRTLIWVALVKEGTTVGAFAIARREVRPFSEKQIALLQNFAAQAVIAMENARLITETREALEQQTATAEILQVINSSPGDLAPVFDAMLQKALALCGAAFGVLWTYDGEYVQAAALRGVPSRFAEFLTRSPHPVGPDNAHGRLLAGEPVVHIADVAEDEAYRSGDPTRRSLVEVGGGRTLLAVPLRKDSRFLGDFVIYRTEVRPFSDKQIALLENFAAQAVIAMENARLLGELRTRTHDLQESLEYQTATSDVLKVISHSFFDLESVLQTVVTTAVRLCRADSATIYRNEGGEYRWAAGHMLLPDYEEIERNVQIRLGPGTLVGRVAAAGQTVQIRDAWTDPLYEVKNDARIGGVHTMLGVPLLREGVPIGVIGLARRRVEGFSEREIALVTTFADQAVIAIENARLFGELRERTAELGRSVEELKMLGEVGRAVSSTLDLRAVLSTILTASLGMTWATAGAIFRYIRAERAFRLVETVGWDEALLGSVSDLSIAETETLMSEAALQRTPIQLTDLAELPSTRLRDASLAAGLRSVLIVPLVGPERIFGALVLQRREAGEFPAETVRLMQTLASQSVLAIQNARLFREIADKSEQLALASQHKSQFLANMSHELRTPLNAILGYAELLVDGIYGVLPEKAQGVLERVQNNGKHLLALINDVLDLAKIEAGQLALTLEDYALAEIVRGVVTATEPLAAAKGLKFAAIVQEGMPMAHGDARRVSQVLLNLAGNAIKFTDQGEVEINASAVNGQFVLTVRDTGPGIADADQERIFGEFQQIDNSDTRKKGGSGLGLAISRRMVEMQGGLISVESVLGAGSTFRVVLPVHVEPALEEAA